MQAPAFPKNELERLAVLQRLDVLDTAPEPSFDRITELAQAIFKVPTVLVSLVDKDRQWFKAKVGFEETQTPREVSFCAHAVAAGETLVVNDACKNQAFADNPLVAADNGIRFYAGALVSVHDTIHLGTLCLIDTQPREFSARDQQLLEALAGLVSDELQLRFALHNQLAEQRLFEDGPVAVMIWRNQADWPVEFVAKNVEQILGYAPATMYAENFSYLGCVYHDDRALVREVLRQLSEGERDHWEIDYRVLTAAGELRWVRQVCRADANTKGEVVRIRGYLIEQTQRKQLEMMVQDANERFMLALDAGALSTWDWDLASDRIHFSERWLHLLGLDSQEGRTALDDWRDRIHPADRQRVRDALDEHLSGLQNRLDVRFRLRHEKGHWVWMHSVGKLVERDAQGRPLRLVGTHRDITDQVENEVQRTRQQRILDLLSSIQNEFMIERDFAKAGRHLLDVLMDVTQSEFGLVGEFTEASRSKSLLWVHGLVNKATGASDYSVLVEQGLEVSIGCDVLQQVALRGETVIENQRLFTDENSLSPLTLPALETILAMPIVFNREVVGLMMLGNAEEGYERSQLAMLRPVMDAMATMVHTRRIEEQRQLAQAELKRLATTDELTGIANRRVFLNQVQQAIDTFKRYDQPVAIMLIDLDHFKRVNDTYGHGAGDDVLKGFTQRVVGELRELDVFGRLGGEEFAILFPHTDLADAAIVAERIRTKLAERPLLSGDTKIPVTLSAGLVAFEAKDLTADKWLARADEALYQAKSQGRNRVVEGEVSVA